jgi:hypothetical protein
MKKPVRLTREIIRERAARVSAVNDRTNPTGMKRPARPAAKHDELQFRGGLGPFEEAPSPRPTPQPARQREER